MDEGKKKLLIFLKNRRIKKSKQILKTFSDVFNPEQLAYMAVLGQSELRDSEWEKEFPSEVPSGLVSYRYLLHPIRLSIMKLLYKNFSMTSIAIKNQLSISWGDFSNHVNSLDKRKYVSLQTEFHEGIQRQVVYLEELGRLEYKALIGLLKDFLIDAEHNLEKSNSEGDLYPVD